MYKHHPPDNFLSSDFRQTADLFQIGAELHLLQKNRRKYRKHFIGRLLQHKWRT